MFREEYLQVPFLREFTVEELSQLLNYAEEQSHQPEEVVFRQGDHGRELYVVTGGKIRFEYVKPETGEMRILQYATYGALFGEVAFLHPQPRTASAVAEEQTSLLVFRKPDVQKLIDLYPTLAATFYHAMAIELANRLRITTPRIT